MHAMDLRVTYVLSNGKESLDGDATNVMTIFALIATQSNHYLFYIKQ